MARAFYDSNTGYAMWREYINNESLKYMKTMAAFDLEVDLRASICEIAESAMIRVMPGYITISTLDTYDTFSFQMAVPLDRIVWVINNLSRSIITPADIFTQIMQKLTYSDDALVKIVDDKNVELGGGIFKLEIAETEVILTHSCLVSQRKYDRVAIPNIRSIKSVADFMSRTQLDLGFDMPFQERMAEIIAWLHGTDIVFVAMRYHVKGNYEIAVTRRALITGTIGMTDRKTRIVDVSKTINLIPMRWNLASLRTLGQSSVIFTKWPLNLPTNVIPHLTELTELGWL